VGQLTATGGAVSAPTYSFIGDTDTGISRPTTNVVNIVTAGAERMRIDASGNVGIGRTPSSWPSNGDFRALQVGSGLSLYGRSSSDVDRVGMTANAYVDVTNDRFEYIGTGHATEYRQSDGTHIFNTAASGSADGAIDFATVMNITADGEVTMPKTPAFQAANSSTQENIATGSQVTVALGDERFDVGANFASNTFQAPVTGRYQLQVSARIDNIDSAANYYELRIDTSNRGYTVIFDPDFGQDAVFWYMAFSILADMDASDTSHIEIRQEGGTSQSDIVDIKFSGYLAC